MNTEIFKRIKKTVMYSQTKLGTLALSEQDVDDISQEAAIRVLRDIQKGKAVDGDDAGLIHVNVMDALRNWLRDNRSHREATGYLEELAADDDGEPLDWQEVFAGPDNVQDEVALRQAFARIPADLQDVARLAAQGYTVREIAIKLGMGRLDVQRQIESIRKYVGAPI